MTALYLQSGWGHLKRVAELADNPGVNLRGVILSPQHLSEARIPEAVSLSPGEVLIDPQTYVYSIPDGEASRHESHGLAPTISTNMSARQLTETVGQVIELNDRLGLGRVVAPAPLMSGFLDPWSQLGSSLLSTTLDMTDRPVLATVAVDSAAFSSWDDVEYWLDAFTQLDVEGIYLAVANESTYPPSWDVEQLAAILRFVYRLGALNDYEVIWGFSDLAGLISLGAGASSFASGWFYGLRRFSRGAWVPSSGGRQPTPRVTMPHLLATVRGDMVTSDWVTLGALDGLTRESADRVVEGDWAGGDSWPQHIEALSSLSNQVSELPPEERPWDVRARLAMAVDLLNRLEDAGVALEAGLRARVTELVDAFDRFLRLEGLA